MDKILIVDDVNLNLRILEDHLLPYYEVLKARNGKQALELAITEKPILILMDIVMPEMDGVEATQKLKEMEATRQIPVIFITALDQINDMVKGFEVGGVDYIIKPYNPQEVLTRVNTQIRIIKYQQQILDLERKNSVLAMVVTANHELRQPLTTLKGYLEMHLDELKEQGVYFSDKPIKKFEKAIDSMIKILDKYKNNQDFDITSYLRDEEQNMDIKMVKFKEE